MAHHHNYAIQCH